MLAAATALALGLYAAIMDVGGHQPWDGRTIWVVTATHGLHVGDVTALVPLGLGVSLARWCWGRR